MSNHPDRPRRRFTLILEALPHEVPGIIRLRRALKFLLRSCGLRCVEAREIPPDPPDEQHQEPAASH